MNRLFLKKKEHLIKNCKKSNKNQQLSFSTRGFKTVTKRKEEEEVSCLITYKISEFERNNNDYQNYKWRK